MVSINFSKKNRSGPFRGTVDVKQEIGHIPFQNIIDVSGGNRSYFCRLNQVAILVGLKYFQLYRSKLIMQTPK